MSDILKTLLQDYDHEWISRQRSIDTIKMVNIICNSSYNRHGVCNAAEDHGVTPSAVCKAQRRFPKHGFKDIHHRYNQRLGDTSRTYAIDGSKVHVPRGFINKGFKTRTNDQPVARKAKRPMAMLSVLVDVHTKRIHAYTVTKHFNERLAAQDLLEHLHPGDTVVFDRGYFSFSLFETLHMRGIHAIFRLKRDAFKSAAVFYNKPHANCISQIVNKQGDIVPLLLHKYWHDGSKFMFGVTSGLGSSVVKKLYGLRWQVELAFRRLKSTLNLEYTFSLSPHIWEQHVEARVLIDTHTVQVAKLTHTRPQRVAYGLAQLDVGCRTSTISVLKVVSFTLVYNPQEAHYVNKWRKKTMMTATLSRRSNGGPSIEASRNPPCEI